MEGKYATPKYKLLEIITLEGEPWFIANYIIADNTIFYCLVNRVWNKVRTIKEKDLDSILE